MDSSPSAASGGIGGAAIAGLVGFAVMSVELTAVRLMAPHFGDSAFVWTNVIGVILLALALGAYLGGRASARDRVDAALAWVLLAGGVVCALVPWVADPVGEWLLPGDLPLDATADALVRGSLVASTLLFAPVVLLAGMGTPMLVTLLVRHGRPVGGASALVAAWSTIGSLVGTFATTHALVPGIGSRLTMIVCAAMFVASAAFVLRWRAAVAGGMALALGFAGAFGARTPERDGRDVLAEVESALQFLRVVRTEGEEATTQLQINEGLDSFHSIAIDGTAFTGGRYYDYFVAAPYLADRPGGVSRVASLGAATGTFERLLASVFPTLSFDSVELDPAVVRLAEQYFGGFPDGARVFEGLDARVFVECADEAYDVVIVDAYERQIYIPAHVASVEFFEAVSTRLEDGGVVAINVGGRSHDDPVVQVVAATVAHVFGEADVFRVPNSRNFVVLGMRGGAIDRSALDRVVPSGEAMEHVLTRLKNPAAWRRVVAGGEVLTDDRPFLDRVQDAALRDVDRREDPTPWSMGGGASSPADAETDAYAALRADDLQGVRRAVQRSAGETPLLRLYAGDARWLDRDLRGALAEYEAAKRAAGASTALRSTVEGRITSLSAEVEQYDRAGEVESRNGWLALLVLVLLGGGVGFAGLRTA